MLGYILVIMSQYRAVFGLGILSKFEKGSEWNFCIIELFVFYNSHSVIVIQHCNNYMPYLNYIDNCYYSLTTFTRTENKKSSRYTDTDIFRDIVMNQCSFVIFVDRGNCCVQFFFVFFFLGFYAYYIWHYNLTVFKMNCNMTYSL